jgi:hypothetical protein
MTEAAAAAAGGSIGGAAGKKVSDGISNIFTKVDQTTSKAAHTDGVAPATRNTAAGTLIEVGPGTPKGDGSSVPPPPPRRLAVRRPAPPVAAVQPAEVEIAPVTPPPPAPPPVTADDLKTKVTNGMERQDLLRLGQPAARISMFDDGHFVEIFRYMAQDSTIGAVRLTDGAVSNVQVQ